MSEGLSREQITSSAFGRTVSVTAITVASAALRPHLPFWWQDCEEEPEFEVEIYSVHEATEGVRGLEHWVAEHATEAVFIHAAMVAVEDRALLLPGRSMTGKSALAAALLRAGAAYGSDEYALLTPDGLVHAYPRPLMLRNDTGLQRVEAAELGASVVDRPLAVYAIGDIRHGYGAEWSVTEMTPGEAALHLIDNAVAAQTRSLDVFHTVATVTAQVRRSVRGVRGDADLAACELLELLA